MNTVTETLTRVRQEGGLPDAVLADLLDDACCTATGVFLTAAGMVWERTQEGKWIPQMSEGLFIFPDYVGDTKRKGGVTYMLTPRGDWLEVDRISRGEQERYKKLGLKHRESKNNGSIVHSVLNMFRSGKKAS